MTTTLTIDPELQALIPPLTDEERQQLEENIRAEGCRDPLVAWQNGNGRVLIDGHHRYKICTQHDIPYEVHVHPTVKTRDDARLFIVNTQMGRRNLNPYQRTRLALQKKNIIAAQAREHQRQAGGAVPSTLTEAPIDTRDEIAKSAGVSTGTIHKVEQILLGADERTKQCLERGEVSVNEAYKTVRKAERWATRERLREEAVIECPKGEGIITGDAELLFDRLQDDSVDMFLTDPPWNTEGLEAGAYSLLGRLAQAKLKPGGFCLAYSGKTFRPVLVFAKPPVGPAPHWVSDGIRGSGRDKRYHDWGQSVHEITAWIENLSEPNDLIVDPYCGGGTVPLACLATKRRWLATEIDPETAAVARQRIWEAALTKPALKVGV